METVALWFNSISSGCSSALDKKMLIMLVMNGIMLLVSQFYRLSEDGGEEKIFMNLIRLNSQQYQNLVKE